MLFCLKTLIPLNSHLDFRAFKKVVIVASLHACNRWPVDCYGSVSVGGVHYHTSVSWRRSDKYICWIHHLVQASCSLLLNKVGICVLENFSSSQRSYINCHQAYSLLHNYYSHVFSNLHTRAESILCMHHAQRCFSSFSFFLHVIFLKLWMIFNLWN